MMERRYDLSTSRANALAGLEDLRYKGRKFDKNGVAKLLANMQHTKIENLKDSLNLFMDVDELIYQFMDGRILLHTNNGKGMLYQNIQELKAVLGLNGLESEPSIPDDFISRIPELIDLLSKRIHSGLSIEDRIDGLHRLDYALKDLPFSELEESYVINLIAYCGQVLANQVDGVWEMLNDDSLIYPVIKCGDKTYDFSGKIMDEYYDAREDFSFAVMVEQVIDPFEFK